MIWLPVLTENCNAPTTCVFAQFAKRYLLSAYQFIMGERDIELFHFVNHVTRGKFRIIDSGIYTIYKDLWQGKFDNIELTDHIKDYTHKYMELLSKAKVTDPFIEVDSQNITAPDDIWELREIIRSYGFEKQVIYVWHLDDGMEAFERLIKDPKVHRISISGREWQERGVPIENWLKIENKYKDDFVGKHVHVLGTTNPKLYSHCADSHSCDTSSWNAMLLYGEAKVNGQLLAKWKNKKLYAPPKIIERIEEHLDDMRAMYVRHPHYCPSRNRSGVRMEYMRASAVALLAHIEYYDSLRVKSPNTDMSLHDPIDYWDRNS